MQKSKQRDAAKPLIDLTNPHDGYFKSLLGRRALAVEFLRLYLPSDMTADFDWRNVERVEDSFISEELRKYFSDLIYRVRIEGGQTVYVYILLEHKSTPDKWVALQLLGYKVKLWEQAKESGASVLPMIIPVVFYHGQKRWNVSARFGDLVEGSERDEWRRFVPDFEYYLFDLSLYSDDEIAGSPGLQAGLLMMKYIFNADLGERLEGIIGRMRGLPTRYLRSLLIPIATYAGAATKMDKDELEQKLLRAFSKIGEENMPSPAQIWIQQAQQQDRADFIELVTYLLENRLGGLSKRTQAQIRRLPLADLKALGKLVLKFETAAELNAWLREHRSTLAA